MKTVVLVLAALAASLSGCGDEQQFKVINGCEIRLQTSCPNVDLSGQNLEGAELAESNLSRSNLEGANLVRASLRSSDVSNSNLRDVNAVDANFLGADLRGSDLRGANFDGANLRAANFEDAQLEGISLRGAQLATARGLPPECPEPPASCPGAATCSGGVCIPDGDGPDPSPGPNPGPDVNNDPGCEGFGCPCMTSGDCGFDFACELDFGECVPRECDFDEECDPPNLLCFDGLCRFSE
jgi:hypothetical protein